MGYPKFFLNLMPGAAKIIDIVVSEQSEILGTEPYVGDSASTRVRSLWPNG